MQMLQPMCVDGMMDKRRNGQHFPGTHAAKRGRDGNKTKWHITKISFRDIERDKRLPEMQ
jgi:hypothetical protein